jgi:hypothetical protein
MPLWCSNRIRFLREQRGEELTPELTLRTRGAKSQHSCVQMSMFSASMRDSYSVEKEPTPFIESMAEDDEIIDATT